MNCSKRVKLSGAFFRKEEEERSAKYMKTFLVRKGNNEENDNLVVNCGLHSNSIDNGEAEPAKENNISSDSDSDPHELLEGNTTDDEVTHQTIDSTTTQRTFAANIFEDAGLWPMPITDSLRCELISRGTFAIQNKNGPFLVVESERKGAITKGKTRSLTKEWFYRTLDDGEKILRSWMVYSPKWSCIYCFCCRIFNSQEVQSNHNSFINGGFQKWWKLNPKISQHENSLEHLKAFEKWKELEMRLGKGWTLDMKLQEQISAERSKWVKVLDVF